MAGVALPPLLRLAESPGPSTLRDLRNRASRSAVRSTSSTSWRGVQRHTRPAPACGRGDAAVQHRAGSRAAHAAGRAARRGRDGHAAVVSGTYEAGRRFASQLEEIDKLKRLINQDPHPRAGGGWRDTSSRLRPFNLGELARGARRSARAGGARQGRRLSMSEPVDDGLIVDAETKLLECLLLHMHGLHDHVHARWRRWSR